MIRSKALFDTPSKRLLGALLSAVAVAFACFPFVNQDPAAMLLVGDLPGFYGLGRIILEGQGSRLYDFEYQQAIQNNFWPQLDNTFFPTMYPPVVGVLMAGVAVLPPFLARVFIAGCLLSMLAFLIRRMTVDMKVERFTLVLFSLPVFISIVAPQNTVVSLLFICVCQRYLKADREFLAGLWGGLLLYKPQVGVPFLSVTATSSSWRFVAGALMAAMGQYVVAYTAFGGEWLIPWIDKIKGFSTVRFSLDGYQFTAVTRGIAPFILEGALGRLWELFAFGLCMVSLLVWAWGVRKDVSQRARVLTCFLATFPVFVPQTNFYDLGIALFAVLSSVALETKRALYSAIFLVIVVNVCVSVRDTSLSLVPIAALVVAGYFAWTRRYTS
jgi:hypothetical protein